MKLSDEDKNQIALINEQVLILQEKNASDEAIIEALMDFVPDVVCLVQNMDRSQLQVIFDDNAGWAYLISIIHLALK